MASVSSATLIQDTILMDILPRRFYIMDIGINYYWYVLTDQ